MQRVQTDDFLKGRRCLRNDKAFVPADKDDSDTSQWHAFHKQHIMIYLPFNKITGIADLPACKWLCALSTFVLCFNSFPFSFIKETSEQMFPGWNRLLYRISIHLMLMNHSFQHRILLIPLIVIHWGDFVLDLKMDLNVLYRARQWMDNCQR